MPKAADCCGLQETIRPHDEGSFKNNSLFLRVTPFKRLKRCRTRPRLLRHVIRQANALHGRLCYPSCMPFLQQQTELHPGDASCRAIRNSNAMHICIAKEGDRAQLQATTEDRWPILARRHTARQCRCMSKP